MGFRGKETPGAPNGWNAAKLGENLRGEHSGTRPIPPYPEKTGLTASHVFFPSFEDKGFCIPDGESDRSHFFLELVVGELDHRFRGQQPYVDPL